LVVVVAQPSTQERRLIAGFGLSEAEARARVLAQLPAGKRKEQADYVIDGERPLAEVAEQVEAVWADLCREAQHDAR
jgi:dephospho-CoA kinase